MKLAHPSPVTRTALALLLAITGCATAAAQNQAYPARPIRLVVPNAPGGGTDVVSRLLSVPLTDSLGQSVVVDNRGGGSAIIGSMIVAKAAPDGYTLLMATNASHAINPGLFPDLPYDPIRDFTPIVAIGGVPSVLVVVPAFPAKTVKEFVAYGLAQGGKLNHGSSGTGGTGHLTAEMFKAVTGVRATHVPYKSDGPALVDLMGGHLSFTFANMPGVVAFVKGGRLRAVALTAPKRSPVMPDVPTFVENNVQLEILPWYSVVGPAGMPKPLVTKLNGEINKALTQPEFLERLSGLGTTVIGGAPEQVTAIIKSDLPKYAKAIKDSGAKPD